MKLTGYEYVPAGSTMLPFEWYSAVNNEKVGEIKNVNVKSKYISKIYPTRNE